MCFISEKGKKWYLSIISKVNLEGSQILFKLLSIHFIFNKRPIRRERIWSREIKAGKLTSAKMIYQLLFISEYSIWILKCLHALTIYFSTLKVIFVLFFKYAILQNYVTVIIYFCRAENLIYYNIIDKYLILTIYDGNITF